MSAVTPKLIEELKAAIAMAECSGFQSFAVPCDKMDLVLARLADLESLREAVEDFRPLYNAVALGRFRGERDEGDEEDCGKAATKLFAALAKLTTTGETK